MTSNKDVLAEMIAQLLKMDPELHLLVKCKLEKESSGQIQPLQVPEADDLEVHANWYDNWLGLSLRTANILLQKNISPKMLMSMSKDDLSAVDGLGGVSIEGIRLQMIRHNLQSTLNPPPKPT